VQRQPLKRRATMADGLLTSEFAAVGDLDQVLATSTGTRPGTGMQARYTTQKRKGGAKYRRYSSIERRLRKVHTGGPASTVLSPYDSGDKRLKRCWCWLRTLGYVAPILVLLRAHIAHVRMGLEQVHNDQVRRANFGVRQIGAKAGLENRKDVVVGPADHGRTCRSDTVKPPEPSVGEVEGIVWREK
jgi:hypothetical protein